MKTTINKIAFLCATIGAIAPEVNADGPIRMGNGAFGANRRVETPAERYISIGGIFTEPDITIPPNNIARSKPTFYLGSHSGIDRVDAGLQFEVPIPAAGIDAGWVIFFDSNLQERAGLRFGVPPQPQGEPGWTSVRPDGVIWRIPEGELGTAVLRYRNLLNGAVQLIVESTNRPTVTAYADPVGSGNNADVPAFPTQAQGGTNRITIAALSSLAVRRVIGITQDGTNARPVTYDGSTSTENLFSLLGVAQATIANNSPLLTDGEMSRTWRTQDDDQFVWDSVNQTTTGFSPEARDGDGNWVFDFSYQGSSGTPNYRAAAVPARYNIERVHIRLHQGIRVIPRPRGRARR